MSQIKCRAQEHTAVLVWPLYAQIEPTPMTDPGAGDKKDVPDVVRRGDRVFVKQVLFVGGVA